jgi:hypothetical protein
LKTTGVSLPEVIEDRLNRFQNFPRSSASGASEFIFIALILSLTRLGNEFGSSGEGVSPWYMQSPFGVPWNFVLLFVLALLVAPYVSGTPSFSVARRLSHQGIWFLAVAGWAVIGLAIVVGILNNSPELFADWRNFVVMALVVVFASKWTATQDWRRFAIADLAIAYGVLAVPTLIRFATDTSPTLLGVRTTTFDGSTLYTACFAAVAAAWYSLNPGFGFGQGRLRALKAAGIAASLLVLLSFRRSFWLAWIVGVAVVVLLTLRSRRIQGIRIYVATTTIAVLLTVTTIAIGTEEVIGRVESFLPGSNSRYAATNQDHINDVLDAWRVVASNPILGLGIGRHYETELITDWKAESFEVHNAVLHVWLKFGLAGAVIYVLFHFGLVRVANRSFLTVPISGFLVGELAATLFGTWPYGSFQMSVFHGVLIACLVTTDQNDEQSEPSLHRVRPHITTGSMPS